MPKRGKPADDPAKRAWFVYQVTDTEGDVLSRASGLFASDTPEFKSLEARLRALARACGFDQYIMLDRCGHMFYACGRKGGKCPTDRALLQQWAAEDRASIAALAAHSPAAVEPHACKGEL